MAPMTTVAAIDCGTNTIKLLVGIHSDTGLEVLVRESRMVRLGQGVDATGRLSEEALVRAFDAIDAYADLITDARGRAHQVLRHVGDARRQQRGGVPCRRARPPRGRAGGADRGRGGAVAFAGAMSNVPADAARPILVVDIGGGSTEVVLGDDDGVIAAKSMDIGSVRLHERHIRHDPASRDEIAAVVRDIDDQLDACGVDLAAAATVVGIAGTMTTVAAGVLDLATYDPKAVDGRCTRWGTSMRTSIGWSR